MTHEELLGPMEEIESIKAKVVSLRERLEDLEESLINEERVLNGR